MWFISPDRQVRWRWHWDTRLLNVAIWFRSRSCWWWMSRWHWLWLNCRGDIISNHEVHQITINLDTSRMFLWQQLSNCTQRIRRRGTWVFVMRHDLSMGCSITHFKPSLFIPLIGSEEIRVANTQVPLRPIHWEQFECCWQRNSWLVSRFFVIGWTSRIQIISSLYSNHNQCHPHFHYQHRVLWNQFATLSDRISMSPPMYGTWRSAGFNCTACSSRHSWHWEICDTIISFPLTIHVKFINNFRWQK